MATLNGAYYLQKTKGGKGKLISGVPGVSPAKVLVLGGGVVGEAAAMMAAGLGADVTINVHTLYSSEHNIRQMLPTVDIVVGSVLVPGDKTPHLITKEMLKLMEPGTVLVDVAIDQGGYRRWYRALLCGEYSRRSAQHFDVGTDECHLALCHSLGR